MQGQREAEELGPAEGTSLQSMGAQSLGSHPGLYPGGDSKQLALRTDLLVYRKP